MIPEVIHRIWLDEPMPDIFTRFGKQWQDTHPHYQLVDWCHTSDLPALNNQDLYDRARELVPRDWVRFRSDLVRLELIWQLGGVYVDTDTTPRRPLPTPDVTAWAARSPKRRGGKRPVTNAVFAAAPHHPFIGRLIEEAPGAVVTHAGEPLAQIIGPWHFTRVYEARSWPDVKVFGPGFYHKTVNHRWNSRRRRKGKALA